MKILCSKDEHLINLSYWIKDFILQKNWYMFFEYAWPFEKNIFSNIVTTPYSMSKHSLKLELYLSKLSLYSCIMNHITWFFVIFWKFNVLWQFKKNSWNSPLMWLYHIEYCKIESFIFYSLSFCSMAKYKVQKITKNVLWCGFMHNLVHFHLSIARSLPSNHFPFPFKFSAFILNKMCVCVCVCVCVLWL
jgi:hypothetical protein